MVRLIHDFFTFIYNFVSKLFGSNRRFYKYDEEMPAKKDKGSSRMSINELNEKINLTANAQKDFSAHFLTKTDFDEKCNELNGKVKLAANVQKNIKNLGTVNISFFLSLFILKTKMFFGVVVFLFFAYYDKRYAAR